MADTTTTGHGKPEAGTIWAERLRLETQVGRSAGSTVWKATCLRTGAAKALRLLPETMLLAAGSERDLRAVIAQYAAAKIEGVVAPEELIVAPGGAGIVLPWTDGTSLADLRLEPAEGCLAPAPARALLIQLAAILQRVHAAGLVHGALKPTNVFVDRNGQVWLADFGSAWWVGEALMRLGSQIAVMAAMPYWSFERAMGDPASVADDIHAFGATAYELLAGRPPVQPNAVGMQQMGKPPASIASRRREAGAQPADLDEAFDQLIMSCLAKEPAQRPPSFAAVLKALGVAPVEAPAKPAPVAAPAPEPAPPSPSPVAPTPPAPQAETVSVPPPAVAPVTLVAPVAAPEPPVAATTAAAAPVAERAPAPTPPALPEPPAPAVQGPAAAPPTCATAPKPAPEPVAKPAPAKTGSSLHYGEPKKKGSSLPLVVGVLVAAAAGGYFLYTRDAAPGPEPVVVAPPAPPTLADELRRDIAAMPLDATDEKITALEVKLAASLPTVPAADQGSLKATWQERQQAIKQWRAEQSVGAVEFSSTPGGAEVWAGGERRGTTPLTLSRLPKGRFAFELRLPGHVPQKAEVAVEGGKSVTWQGSLMRAKGTLRVQSSAAGDAFEVVAAATSAVVARGVTPQELALPEGDYRVSVERSGFRPIEQRVEVGAGATVAVEARFAEGRLKATAPEGSLFSVGGVVRGMAPLDLALPPGEHMLSVEYPGGRKEERRVFVQASQTLDLRFQPPAEVKPEPPVVKPDPPKPDPVTPPVTTPVTTPVTPPVTTPSVVTPAEPKKPAPVDYDRVFELSEVTRRPVPVNRVEPEMPARFRQNGLSGEVEVSAIVDRTGAVTPVSVVRSTHAELNDPTLNALRRWRFKPAEKDGRAVAVRVVIPVGYSVEP